MRMLINDNDDDNDDDNNDDEDDDYYKLKPVNFIIERFSLNLPVTNTYI